MDPLNREFVRLMLESGWTSAVCQERLGLSKGAISQYRNGVTRPSLPVLRLYSALSGVPLLLPGESSPPLKGVEPVTDQERQFIQLIRRFRPGQRTAIAAMLSELSEPESSSEKVDRVADLILDQQIRDIRAPGKAAETSTASHGARKGRAASGAGSAHR